ncbi:hypothetical protein JL722_12883 [Aureococcus anophagefferens]|nr:hypothetical protein JL722_12883 [Aureococcus anophagefferens]
MHAAKPVHSLLKLDDPYDVEATRTRPPTLSSARAGASSRPAPRRRRTVRAGSKEAPRGPERRRRGQRAPPPQAKDCGQDLDADQACSPRIFKSHMNPSNVNPGCRVVTPSATRKGRARIRLKVKGAPFVKDVANALDFVDHPMFMAGPVVSSSKRGPVPRGDVVRAQGRRARRALRDAVQDTPKWIAKTAAFMGVDCDAALVDNVAKHTDKQYMLDHATQFDDHWITEQQAKAGRGFVVQKGSKVTTTAHEKPDGPTRCRPTARRVKPVTATRPTPTRRPAA